MLMGPLVVSAGKMNCSSLTVSMGVSASSARMAHKVQVDFFAARSVLNRITGARCSQPWLLASWRGWRCTSPSALVTAQCGNLTCRTPSATWTRGDRCWWAVPPPASGPHLWPPSDACAVIGWIPSCSPLYGQGPTVVSRRKGACQALHDGGSAAVLTRPGSVAPLRSRICCLDSRCADFEALCKRPPGETGQKLAPRSGGRAI